MTTSVVTGDRNSARPPKEPQKEVRMKRGKSFIAFFDLQF